MKAFVIGMHNAFLVSTVLVIIAAAISFVRGHEDRGQLAEQADRTISSPAD